MKISPYLRLKLAGTFLFLAVFVSNATAELQRPEILFDEGHGMLFVIDQTGPLHLSEFAGIIGDRGGKVTRTREKLTNNVLTGKKAVVISGPFKPISDGEIDAMVNFLQNGGRCAIMLHIPNPAAHLLQRLYVHVSNGVVHDRSNTIDGKGLDFYITDLARHPLTEGMDRFAVYGAWTLLTEGADVKTIASTGQGPGSISTATGLSVPESRASPLRWWRRVSLARENTWFSATTRYSRIAFSSTAIENWRNTSPPGCCSESRPKGTGAKSFFDTFPIRSDTYSFLLP